MKFTDSQLLNSAFEGKKQLRNSGLNYYRLENSGIEPGKRYYINGTNINVQFFARHGGIEKFWSIGKMGVKKETAIKRYNLKND